MAANSLFVALATILLQQATGAISSRPAAGPASSQVSSSIDGITFQTFADSSGTRILHVCVAPPTGANVAPEAAARIAGGLKEALSKSFVRFQVLDPGKPVESAAEHYYLDLYPLLDKSGDVLCWIELFGSQNAARPLYSNVTELRATPIGDLRAVVEAPLKMAESLIPLPSRAGAASPSHGSAPNQTTTRPLPRNWRVVPRPGGPRMIRFAFAAPVEGHGGEFARGRGEVELEQPGVGPGRLRGWFEVDPGSVSTGDSELDEGIRSDVILNVAAFPNARFTLEHARDLSGPIEPGRPTIATLVGVFTLKGVSTPLLARAMIEPVRDGSGQLALRLYGSFRLNLESLGVFPPPGPSPQQHLMLLEFDFALVPPKGE